MKRTIIVLCLALVSWGANAQHDHSKMNHSNMDSKMMAKSTDLSSISVKSSKSAKLILDSYITLKNALVEDDSKKAASAGQLLLDALTNFNIEKQPKAQKTELNDIIEDAKEQAEHISENSGKIEHQREHFEILSTDIKDLIVIAGSDRNLYQIYCPMYNNNEGGTWLSESKEIKNPFLGTMMMKCGNVQQEIIVE